MKTKLNTNVDKYVDEILVKKILPAITKTQKIVVNGKIDKIQKQVDTITGTLSQQDVTMKEFIVTVTNHIKSDAEWKAEQDKFRTDDLQPMVNTRKGVIFSGKALMKGVTVIASLLGLLWLVILIRDKLKI